MAILAMIGQGVAIANGIAAIAARLNEARSMVLQIDNHAPFDLRMFGQGHAHGGFAEIPPQILPAGQVAVFGSQSAGGAAGTGTEGHVDYAGDMMDLTVHWGNPFFGANWARANLTGARATAFNATAIAGTGNQKAHVRYELLPVGTVAVDLADYSMMRELSSPKVFVMIGGAKLWVRTGEAVEHFGGWGAVKVVADHALAHIPTVPADGVLLREWSGAAVYLMAGGQRHWVSAARFGELGLNWDQVMKVPDGSLVDVPEGPPA